MPPGFHSPNFAQSAASAIYSFENSLDFSHPEDIFQLEKTLGGDGHGCDHYARDGPSDLVNESSQESSARSSQQIYEQEFALQQAYASQNYEYV